MSKVLLADDSPHAQRMGLEILSREGFQVRCLADGWQFMENLREFAPDLVLADVHLPGESGYRICEQIKKDPAQEHVKVVLLVGALEPFDPAEAERVGADGVLHKPFEASLVVKLIRPLLAGQFTALRAADKEVRAPAAPPLHEAPCPAKVETNVPAEAGEQEDFAAAVRQALSDAGPEARPDPDRVRAAVVLAVESALPDLLDQLTERVLAALRQVKP